MSDSNTDDGRLATSIADPQEAFREVQSSFERFCLISGISVLEQMLKDDATELYGERHARNRDGQGCCWGTSEGPIGFQGGKTKIKRPRVRVGNKEEIQLPSWTVAQAESWLGEWAINLMLITVSTRRFGRAVRLPDPDLPVAKGDGNSKSAASRHFVALSAAKMAEWMNVNLSDLDLSVIQIDGLHIKNKMMLIAAVGIDGEDHKHPLAVSEGASENSATEQALIDNLVARGHDPE